MAILNTVYSNAKKSIYEEVAKLIMQRKKLLNYIKILRNIAINITTTPTEIASILSIERNTAFKYLKYLQERAIISSKNGKYYIVDPLIRRALRDPDAKDQIHEILKKF